MAITWLLSKIVAEHEIFDCGYPPPPLQFVEPLVFLSQSFFLIFFPIFLPDCVLNRKRILYMTSR
jgi:hypothetical protein